MRHSGNIGHVINQTYGGEGVTMKVYVYDEVGRFVTVASLALGEKEVQHHLDGIAIRKRELEQPGLFE